MACLLRYRSASARTRQARKRSAGGNAAQRGAFCACRGQGFVTVILDELFFIHDPAAGKYWSPKGEPLVMEYN